MRNSGRFSDTACSRRRNVVSGTEPAVSSTKPSGQSISLGARARTVGGRDLRFYTRLLGKSRGNPHQPTNRHGQRRIVPQYGQIRTVPLLGRIKRI